ncbi:MAG: ferritin-like domain-containing protein [Phycisphaerales bacterium]
MKLDTLKKLYVEQLKDLHSAESQMIEALPKMAAAASAAKLRQAFEHHLKETREHRARIERIFKNLDFSPGGHKCKAMEGLIKEGAEIIKEDGDAKVKDAALVCAAQKVEHYEIGSYGCVHAYARLLGENEAADLLAKTLQEEKHADETLNELAEGWINTFAKSAGPA